MEIVLKRFSEDELRGSVLITGFRGFGMVGYLASKHLALALKAEKAGVILLKDTPAFIAVEEDGVGYPYEIYYSPKHKATIIINRAVPQGRSLVEYGKGLTEWVEKVGFSHMILIGGLNKEFKHKNETFGYRWLKNSKYKGPQLPAPELEEGLGVIGPLAYLYMLSDIKEIPAVMVLSYTFPETIDYDAVLVAVKVVARDLLNTDLDFEELEALAKKQRDEIEKIIRVLESEASRTTEEAKGMYM
ncbi:MAG: PAC2 family protein [Acidilobaceae archaeon]